MAEKQARILIVEDDEDDFILTSEHINQLNGYDFLIDWVTTPNEAIEQLQLGTHDICLLDYQLGPYTGLEVLDLANEKGCSVPIIMLTGQADDSLDEAALNKGATDFLVKGEITSARFTRSIRYAIARKELAMARQESLDAKIKNRTKDQFLAHLSHELRTPLTSIVGYTELLLSQQQNKGIANELTIILSNSKHLLSLLNDILDLSKIEANKLELVKSDVELIDFFSDLIPGITLIANEKGLDLTFESSEQVPTIIHTDKTRLRQVILNLVINAIKFTDEGHIQIKVDCEGEGSDECIVFEIIDTGIGIPEEKIEFIFKPFEQIEEMISKSQLGAGLGLAISNELVRRMHGRISVCSAMHKGSSFKISLPIPHQQELERSKITLNLAEQQSTENFTPLMGHVLVVDDVDDIRMMITKVLQRFNLQVSTARNGKHAIECLNKNPDAYNLVLMDIHMPEMDGREAIAKMRQSHPQLPILALTAGAMKGVDEMLLQLGFNGVINKPINQHAVYQALTNILSPKPSDPAADSTPQQSLTALVVEDDAEAAKLIGILLQTLHYQTDVVTSYDDCLEQINDTRQWDLVLIDKQLHDKNGLELAKRVRLRCPDAQIMIVSGHQISQQQLDEAGADKALLKPITLEQLQQGVGVV